MHTDVFFKLHSGNSNHVVGHVRFISLHHLLTLLALNFYFIGLIRNKKMLLSKFLLTQIYLTVEEVMLI